MLFPLLNDSPAPQTEQQLPPAREFARDARGKLVVAGGTPVIATGAAAVRSWAYAALATVRCRSPIYDAGFGCEVETLIGQRFEQRVKEAEAARMVADALSVSPYVTGVRDVTVEFADATIRVTCALETIYGEVEIRQ